MKLKSTLSCQVASKLAKGYPSSFILYLFPTLTLYSKGIDPSHALLRPTSLRVRALKMPIHPNFPVPERNVRRNSCNSFV